MLSGHPHIKNLKIREAYLHGRLMRRLVVETDLVMPDSGRIEENKELLDLHNYLDMLAAYDFGDFDEVEIRTRKTPTTASTAPLGAAKMKHAAQAAAHRASA